jgi:hypothetical protein
MAQREFDFHATDGIVTFNKIIRRINLSALLPFALREKGLGDEGHTPYQIVKEHDTVPTE